MSKDKPAQKEDACVLVSGGVESMVLLSDALGRYEHVTPFYVRNHLRWEETELFWLKGFLRNLKQPNLRPLKVAELTLRDLYENHWSITGIKIPGVHSSNESVYLPGRNLIFLSKAACFCSMNGITAIEIGVLKGNPFSDSTSRFFRKMSDVLSLGLNSEISVRAPFQKFKKEDVIVMGRKLMLEMTFSCINPKGYEHCGECNKCTERKKAFFGAGVFDKTKYKKSGI